MLLRVYLISITGAFLADGDRDDLFRLSLCAALLSVTVPYRLGVASRMVAAACGSYAVAACAAALLALALPMARADAAVTGSLAAVVLLPFVAISCFWVRSALRAWALMIGLSVLLGGLAMAMGWRP